MSPNRWQKSSYCQEGDACVHVSSAATARVSQKSSYCQEGEACVHISAAPDTIHLTESADPADTVLTAHPTAFAALLDALRAMAGGGRASW